MACYSVIGDRAITRLSDYLRAERPDETEPASFYVPGAPDWRTARRDKLPAGGPDEIELDPGPIDGGRDVDETAAARAVAALQLLEGA